MKTIVLTFAFAIFFCLSACDTSGADSPYLNGQAPPAQVMQNECPPTDPDEEGNPCWRCCDGDFCWVECDDGEIIE